MFPIEPAQIILAVLAFFRVGGIIFALPFFGDDPVPLRVRILISVSITFALYPLIVSSWNTHNFSLTNDVWLVGSLVIRELIIGLSIGYIAKLAFHGVVMAAGLVGYQMGFGVANLFVPTSEEHHNGFTAFNHAFILLIFLSLNYHHIYIQTIFETFSFIPLGAAFPQGAFTNLLITTSAGILVSTVQLSAPIIVAILFSTTALGLVARTVPQVNVFVISFPTGFYVGLLVYVATLPFMPGWMNRHFAHMNGVFIDAMKALVH